MVKKFSIICIIFSICLIVFSYTLSAGRTIIIGDSIYLSKGVKITSDQFICNTDTAIYLRKDSIIFMPEILKIHNKDTVNISAKRGKYNIKDKIFTLYEQNTVSKNNDNINSSFMKIFIKDSVINYAGNVEILIESKSYKILSDTAIQNYKDNYFLIYNSGTLIRISEENYIISDTFLLSLKDSLYHFFHNVNIIENNTKIFTDSFVIFDKEHYAQSYYLSTMKSDSATITGDTIFMYFQNDSIDYLRFLYNIDFINKTVNEENNISCDSIYIDFINNEIDILNFYNVNKAELKLKKDNDDIKN